MEAAIYKFENIFDYNKQSGYLIPKYNFRFDNIGFAKDIALNPTSTIAAEIIYKYQGHDFVGVWDEENKTLIITGIY
ncbi:MAG TPA: hypothetical protein VEP90_07805 [Methylomirabilota bacterium]|nr:hypothetical protein [Methylomirabilota bacterium]